MVIVYMLMHMWKIFDNRWLFEQEKNPQNQNKDTMRSHSWPLKFDKLKLETKL